MASSNEKSLKRVGCYWPGHNKKLDFGQLSTACSEKGICLFQLNLDMELAAQRPMDAILHKLFPQLIAATWGDEDAKRRCIRLQEFADKHPEVKILDPLPSLERILLRIDQYRLFRELEASTDIRTPPFVEIVSSEVDKICECLKRANVCFPIVCKPSYPTGLSTAHQMKIIFNREGLADVDVPCVAQTLLNHNAVLFKIYVMGERHFVTTRPSLKNFDLDHLEEQITIPFHSQQLCRSTFSHDESREEIAGLTPPPPSILEPFLLSLQSRTGLTLFGVDIIVQKSTAHSFVIDLNPFTSNTGVNNVYEELAEFLKRQLIL